MIIKIKQFTLIIILTFLSFLSYSQIVDENYNMALNTIDNDKKIKFLTDCLEKNPENIDCLLLRGETLLKINRYDLSLVDLNKVLKTKIDIDNYEALKLRAILYRMNNEASKSINDLDRLIGLNLNNEITGNAFYMRGDFKKIFGIGLFSYCSDYKKGCDLGNTEACKLFYTECQ